ncbi:MAG: alpha/beta fold hydrolase [Gammaproteobacteria bacterium]
MSESVILVHGIWMVGAELWPLARRLRHCGYTPRFFTYRSLRRSPAHNAARLVRFIQRQPAETIHLVGHSLGGLVILRALQDHPDLVSGRIVLLGSPVQGSAVAGRLHRYAVTRWLVGRSAERGLLGDGPRWQGAQDLGVIAGTRPLGMGRMVGGLPGDSDGTVAVSETVLEGARDTLICHTTHMGLVYSRDVAAAVCHFLQSGRFR